MKRILNMSTIILAVFIATVLSASQDKKPIIQGVIYGEKVDVVHYDSKHKLENKKIKEKYKTIDKG